MAREASCYSIDFSEGVTMKLPNIFNAFPANGTSNQLPKNNIEWPEPEILRDSLLPVNKIVSTNIPEPYREWIADVAERMQCPPDFIAVTAIVVTASIVGTACGVKPKQKDDWLVVPNLWGGLIGRPGMLKTPAVSEVMQLINQLESAAKESYDIEMKTYLADLEISKAEKEAIKGALVNACKLELKSKSSANMLETSALKEEWLGSRDPHKPAWKRYKSNDPTVEKLSEILADNPRGILLYRDELVGLLSNWEKEGRESDRAFFLEAWNGDGSMTVDRIARGTTHVKNLCVSIFGNTQPAKLARYLYQAMRGKDNDGLLQRFQLMIYPDEPKEWELIDREPNHEAKQRVIKIINKIATMNFVEYGAIQERGDRFAHFRFDEQAQDVFNEWLTRLEKCRSESDDHPILIEHLSKYRSLLPSLALLFHLINIADGKQSSKITLDSVTMAIGWCGYLEKHAKRIYSMVNDNNVNQSAIKLSKKIQEGELPSPFTVRDIYRREWAMLNEKETVKKACETLVDVGWIRQELQAYEIGRPKSPIYIINPKLKIHSATAENFF